MYYLWSIRFCILLLNVWFGNTQEFSSLVGLISVFNVSSSIYWLNQKGLNNKYVVQSILILPRHFCFYPWKKYFVVLFVPYHVYVLLDTKGKNSNFEAKNIANCQIIFTPNDAILSTYEKTIQWYLTMLMHVLRNNTLCQCHCENT